MMTGNRVLTLMRYRFADFLYDASNRSLIRGGAEIALTPKTRDLLLLFLENPARLLTRQEISDRLWPDVAVTDDALRFQVSELRKALGDRAESWIRTVPREGYRWGAAVTREQGPRGSGSAVGEISYRLVLESREIELVRGENIIGRDPEAVLWIDHTSVSRNHARIRIGETVTLEDLGSKNGTYLRGEKITGVRGLANGDKIRIGPVSMVFRALSRVGSTETEEKEARP